MVIFNSMRMTQHEVTTGAKGTKVQLFHSLISNNINITDQQATLIVNQLVLTIYKEEK